MLNVQIFSATLRTTDGKIVVVPNGKIIAGNIINFSHEPERRNELIIAVSYDADIDLVKQTLTDIIQADERILKNREIVVRLNEPGASSVNYVVRFWCSSSNLISAYWDFLEQVKRTFDEKGIDFSYPQMDVHVSNSKVAE